VVENVAAGWREMARHQTQQRCLAAARRPQKRERLAPFQAKVDPAEHLRLGIVQRQIARGDCVFRLACEVRLLPHVFSFPLRGFLYSGGMTL
jgi:hypothetical protein